MKRVVPAILLPCVVLVAGCSRGSLVASAPDRHLPPGFPNHTAEEIIDSLHATANGIRTYGTDGAIAIESPDFSNSAGLSLRSRIGDSLSAVVRGPLGIVAGRALVTRDSLFFADRLSGREYAGRRHGPAPIPPPFNALLEANRGSLGLTALGVLTPVAADSLHPWDVSSDSLHYVLARRLPTLDVTYEIDPTVWMIVSCSLKINEPDEADIQYSLANFDSVDGFVVPRSVTIAYPENQTTITLEHERIRLNPDDLRIGGNPVGGRANRSR